jgi:hypothetical protein
MLFRRISCFKYLTVATNMSVIRDFEVLKAVSIKIIVFWDVTPCNLIYGYQIRGR